MFSSPFIPQTPHRMECIYSQLLVEYTTQLFIWYLLSEWKYDDKFDHHAYIIEIVKVV